MEVLHHRRRIQRGLEVRSIMVLSIQFIMGFMGAAVAMIIGILIFSEVETVMECPEPEIIEGIEQVSECESAKRIAWTIIGIMPIALFFVLFQIFGGFGASVRAISLTNVEQRVKQMQRMGINHILKKTKAQLIDESKRGNKLYAMKDKLIPNYTLKYLVYSDPSSPEKTYGCFIPSSMTKADEGMAWKFQITEEEYDNLEVEA